MPPKYLDHSPLYSVIIEVRFSTKIPEDAVPGVLYSKLSTNGQGEVQISPLPASQLPLQIRQQNLNLKYAPTQRLTVADKIINVGSNVISIEANNGRKEKSYPGWEVFFEQFKDIIKELDFVSRIERVAVRYINLFQEEDLLNELKVSLNTGWESKGLMNNSTIVFFVERNEIKSKVTIATDASIQDESGLKKGQIIDIDTFLEGELPTEDLDLRVGEAHDLTKEIFYSLPSDELLAKMGPHSDESSDR